MNLRKTQADALICLANKLGFRTLGNWTAPYDFVGIIVGNEPPGNVSNLVKMFSSETGIPARAGRLDDLPWTSAIHLNIEWYLLGDKVLCPRKAMLCGKPLYSLPQFVQTQAPLPTRTFQWKYSTGHFLGHHLL